MSNQYETTEYRGINYAGMASDVNKDTGKNVRYGILPMNEVLQAWCDSSEPVYHEPECHEDGECTEAEDHECYDMAEPYAHTVDDGEYKAECGEDGDIFIVESPYFTYAQFCSPCAPGACYLKSPLADKCEDNKAYCLGHDWFDDGKAPYPVYSVKTGERVNPE